MFMVKYTWEQLELQELPSPGSRSEGLGPVAMVAGYNNRW